MNFRITLLLILGMLAVSHAQEALSKADKLFLEYAYKDAIQEYQKEKLERPLVKRQQLNLAEAYFSIGSYKNASKLYLELVKKDSSVSTYHFNKMLQAFSANGEKERVNAFLATKSTSFAKEVIDNAAFNYEILSRTENVQEFKPFNIRANSPQADFSPTFYKERLLFTSAREATNKNIYKPSGESYLDLFLAKISDDNNVVNPKLFKLVPTSKYHQATPFYEEENGVLYYILSNAENGELSFDDNGKNALAIGKVDKDGDFQFLLRDLSTSFYYPYYDTTTERLYFAANFDDSYGGTDIYYVNTNGGNIMSAPVNLGPRINTPGNEIAPYIFENSLYFSSDIFYGLGGMDIYKSNMQADGTLSTPINLGAGMNSKVDDFGFIIRRNSANALQGYFASNRNGGKGKDDIYGFSIANELGLKTLVIKGNVVRPRNALGITDAKVKILASDNTVLKEVRADSNGDYSIEIPWRDRITIVASKDRFATVAQSFSGETLDQFQQNPLDFELQYIDDLIATKEDKTVINTNKFYFTKGSVTISSAIAIELDKVASMLKDFPRLKIQIETHTDSRGASNSNLRLSKQRAEAMKNYLLEHGVSSTSIEKTLGYGESRLTNNCRDGKYCLEILHKQNDRTLFVILNYDAQF